MTSIGTVFTFVVFIIWLVIRPERRHSALSNCEDTQAALLHSVAGLACAGFLAGGAQPRAAELSGRAQPQHRQRHGQLLPPPAAVSAS